MRRENETKREIDNKRGNERKENEKIQIGLNRHSVLPCFKLTMVYDFYTN
jgi:hypothetical protein